MEEAQEKCRNVPRRIGGLEIYGADLRWADLVPRRIGGLETYEDL